MPGTPFGAPGFLDNVLPQLANSFDLDQLYGCIASLVGDEQIQKKEADWHEAVQVAEEEDCG